MASDDVLSSYGCIIYAKKKKPKNKQWYSRGHDQGIDQGYIVPDVACIGSKKKMDSEIWFKYLQKMCANIDRSFQFQEII